MRGLFFVLAAFLPFSLHAQIQIEAAWARATAPGAKVAGGYMLIRNQGAAAHKQ